jgi:exodeoxyribonuclease V alpha subunit
MLTVSHSKCLEISGDQLAAVVCQPTQSPFVREIILGQSLGLTPDERMMTTHQSWYAERSGLITRNDYQLQTFNDDVGTTLPELDADMQRIVCWEACYKSVRSQPPFYLPPYEIVYVVTVHKSQGSEFDDVLLVLADEDSPVMTRALLYTDITRTRSRVTICGSHAAFQTTLDARCSGRPG